MNRELREIIRRPGVAHVYGKKEYMNFRWERPHFHKMDLSLKFFWEVINDKVEFFAWKLLFLL